MARPAERRLRDPLGHGLGRRLPLRPRRQHRHPDRRGRTQDFDWNTENTLQKVTEADGTVTEFLDDADGSRLIRRDKTGTTLYLGETEVRLDKASGKVEATRYYVHGGQAVAVRTPAGLTWIASDHNGTASVQVDAATQAVTRRHMTPFGEDRGKAAGAWVGEKHFVGGTKDPTGLVHLGARDYDPTTGRFVSVDPVADFSDAQQINGYAYSNNNPVSFADPDGKFFGALIALIVAVVRAVMAVLNYVRRRSSQSASSGGMSTMGSANYASAKADSCPLVQRNYGICDNKEPEDACEQGSFKDILGGIGDAITEGLDAVEYATEPWCWGGNSSCGVNDDYKEFTEEHGVDENTKNYDAGKDFTDAASMVNLAGLARHFLKNLFKKAAKKNVPKPKVPEVKMIDGWMPETVLDKLPEDFGPMIPTKKGVGFRFPGPKQDGIRIDKGNLNNSQEYRQVDHVVVNSGEKYSAATANPWLVKSRGTNATPTWHTSL